ncbi:hypothetical protein B5K08_13350 [Rhizobium leguminosarum bv. trifolii]|uniref:Uncharacterized protein n=1 Tax=Rhizobium leguminosarum bv. trifolii TaxID=386 RepID=A0A3E1BKU1_RHILT|nr:hypothetical protein B5K08_13350 [Rhizobium leguminosarum bv. trifolii]RFB93811.1 hypothetical protein B5K10_13340 [Rhizobium leguminosarum bv. trifolii]
MRLSEFCIDIRSVRRILEDVVISMTDLGFKDFHQKLQSRLSTLLVERQRLRAQRHLKRYFRGLPGHCLRDIGVAPQNIPHLVRSELDA